MRKLPFSIGILCALFCLISYAQSFGQGCDASITLTPPNSYDSFHEFDPAVDDLKILIESTQLEQIYLPPGIYEIDNPIVVEHDLYLHGFNRVQTVLQGMNKGEPLFEVEDDASVISVSGLHFFQNNNNAQLGSPPSPNESYKQIFDFSQRQSPIYFEMQDCIVRNIVFSADGPGCYRLQGVTFSMGSVAPYPIEVDHAEADFVLMHGNINTYGNTNWPDPFGYRVSAPEEFCHLRQRQGRVRVYNVQTQGLRGSSEFLFNEGSAYGEHVLSGIRTEFSDGNYDLYLPSSMSFAKIEDNSASTQPVELMVIANSLNESPPSSPPNHNNMTIVDAQTTLQAKIWLIGNKAMRHFSYGVSGNAANSWVFASGNRVSWDCHNWSVAPDELTIHPVLSSGAEVISFGNSRSFGNICNCNTNSCYNGNNGTALIEPNKTLNDYLPTATNFYPVPEIPAYPPLVLPEVWSPLPGMISVASYGANGTDLLDDSDAFQNAINAATVNDPNHVSMIYIPEGEYLISRSLVIRHSNCRMIDCGSTRFDCVGSEPSLGAVQGAYYIGGAMVGAGSGNTKITALCGKFPMITSDYLLSFTFKGIHFQQNADGSNNNPDVGSIIEIETGDKAPLQSQQDYFRDCKFYGGRYGVSAGKLGARRCSQIGSPPTACIGGSNQCSPSGFDETLCEMFQFVNCEFKESHMGFNAGHWNSFNHSFNQCGFKGVDYAIGAKNEYSGNGKVSSGGGWSVYNSLSKDSYVQDFHIEDQHSACYYFNNFSSESAHIYRTENGPNNVGILVFDQSEFKPNNCPVGNHWPPASINAYTGTSLDGFSTKNMGGLVFLHSDLSETSISLQGSGGKFGVALHCDLPCGGCFDEHTTTCTAGGTSATAIYYDILPWWKIDDACNHPTNAQNSDIFRNRFYWYPSGQTCSTSNRMAGQPLGEALQASIYPNPVSNILSCKYETKNEEETVEVKLIQADGKEVFHKYVNASPGENTWQFDLGSYADGMYFLELVANGQLKKTFKVSLLRKGQ